MDIGTAVNWTQVLLWLAALGIYVSRITRGKKRMPAWLLSNRTLGVVIFLGLSATGLSFYFGRSVPGFRENDYTEVRGKKFSNEKVVLDGNKFEYCEFDNVTFVYDGTAGFAFRFNTIGGTIHIETGRRNRGTAYMVALSKGLGQLRSDAPLIDAEDKLPLQNIQPMTPTQPSP